MFAWQVGAGIGYRLSDTVVIQLGYRFLDSSTIQFEWANGTKIDDPHAHDHGVEVGHPLQFLARRALPSRRLERAGWRHTHGAPARSPLSLHLPPLRCRFAESAAARVLDCNPPVGFQGVVNAATPRRELAD